MVMCSVEQRQLLQFELLRLCILQLLVMDPSKGVLRLCAQMRVLQPELPPVPPSGSADPESAAPEPADAGCHVSSAAPAQAAAEKAPERPAATAPEKSAAMACAAAGALLDTRSGVLTRRSVAVTVGAPLLQPCVSHCATCRLCPGLTFLLPAHSLRLQCWDLGTDFHLGMYWSLSAPHVWSCASVAAAASCPEVSVGVNMCSLLLKPSDYWAECDSITFQLQESQEFIFLPQRRGGAEAYAATVRRAAAHFHLGQLASGAAELHAAVNALLPRLPGAAIKLPV